MISMSRFKSTDRTQPVLDAPTIRIGHLDPIRLSVLENRWNCKLLHRPARQTLEPNPSLAYGQVWASQV